MQVVDLEIQLLDMPYPVTRRLRVPVAIRLSDLHQLLQAAMPWDDSHLYDFALGRSLRWTKSGSDDWGDSRSATAASVADVMAELGRKKSFLYTYDMGDSWEHEVTPGKPRGLASGEPAVALLTAEGACPPDDSGGAPGFDRMLEVAADPAHEEHEDIVDWLGDDHPWNRSADVQALTERVRKAGARIVKKLGAAG
jgi:Plasmid pRiA4b ORF-3-like protein